MRKFFVSIALLMALQVQAQTSWNQTYQQYINQYKDIAIEQMQRYHIPASITMTMSGTSVSVPMTMPTSRMRIIRSSSPVASVTVPYSS